MGSTRQKDIRGRWHAPILAVNRTGTFSIEIMPSQVRPYAVSMYVR